MVVIEGTVVYCCSDFSEGVNWWEVREFLLVKDVTGSTRGELCAVTIGALLQNVKFKTYRIHCIHYITCAI